LVCYQRGKTFNTFKTCIKTFFTECPGVLELVHKINGLKICLLVSNVMDGQTYRQTHSVARKKGLNLTYHLAVSVLNVKKSSFINAHLSRLEDT